MEIVRRVIVGVLTGIKSVPKGTEANLTCSGEGMYHVVIEKGSKYIVRVKFKSQ